MRYEFPVLRGLCVAVALFGLSQAALADQIEVGNYGVSAGSMPWAVAFEKGFFKEEGADITGVVQSNGGGTAMRNMLAGSVPFGESGPVAVINAIHQGADLKFVSDDTLTVAEFVWATKIGSPIKTVADLKGKKIGYTNAKSVSQALDILLLQSAGMTQNDADLVQTGGFGESIVALNVGEIDAAPITEPLWSSTKSKFQLLTTAADSLPALDNTVGVTTTRMAATHGDELRAILRARRRGVQYLYAHPDDAAVLVAKNFKMDPEVARNVIHELIASSAKTGVPYWGEGDFHMASMNRMMDAEKMVGAIDGDIDWSKIIDARFLPADLQPKK